MNLGNIFKPLAQSAVDAALPRVKAELLALLSPSLLRALPANQAQVAVAAVGAALDAWTIKL